MIKKHFPLDQLYLDGTKEDERGGVAFVMCHGIDGNFADVYGEDAEDAEANALTLIDALKDYEHRVVLPIATDGYTWDDPEQNPYLLSGDELKQAEDCRR